MKRTDLHSPTQTESTIKKTCPIKQEKPEKQRRDEKKGKAKGGKTTHKKGQQIKETSKEKNQSTGQKGTGRKGNNKAVEKGSTPQKKDAIKLKETEGPGGAEGEEGTVTLNVDTVSSKKKAVATKKLLKGNVTSQQNTGTRKTLKETKTLEDRKRREKGGWMF